MGLKNINYEQIIGEKIFTKPNNENDNLGIILLKTGKIRLVTEGGTFLAFINKKALEQLFKAKKEMERLKWL